MRVLKTGMMSLFLLMLASCAAQSQAASNVKTQTVLKGDLLIGLGADGRVALPVSNLNFAVTGTISKVYVSAGDSVKAGDLLAELDDFAYQFEIENARNNLIKAQSAYDNAEGMYDYSVLSDEKDINKLQRTLNEGFDDYTYQNAVTDAAQTLERRTEDLLKAKEKALTPFDSYAYDNQISEAQKTLAARQKELDEALSALTDTFDDYTYQHTINEAMINLKRKQAALDDALKEAGEFDGYQYDNAISNAQTALTRKLQEYQDAQYAYYNSQSAQYAAYAKVTDAARDYNGALSAYIGKPTDENKAALDMAAQELSAMEAEYNKTLQDGGESKLTSASNSLEDAQKALDNARTDYERAKESFKTQSQTKTSSAEWALDDAQRQLDKALTDLTRAASQNDEAKAKAYEAAQEAYISAEISLEKLETDKARAQAQAIQDAEEQLDSAEQLVTDARTNLDKAAAAVERARADYLKQIEDTRVDLQLKQMNADMNKNSNATVSNALFTLEEAKLKLQEAENNLEQVKLYAPIDGQILSVSRGAGESVSAGSVPAGAVFFGTGASSGSFITLSDVTKIYLTASITEGDIVSVTNGQEIRVTIDAIGTDVFYGNVTNIDSIPQTDANGITTYNVTCLLSDTSSIIKDGMNAYITFMQLERADVLLIPNRAVFMEDELQYVFVVSKDGSYEKRKVVCGLSNGVQTEVVSGLTEGEDVINGRLNQ